MSSSTMSLIGLYNYYPDLFKFLAVPNEIDKSTLIDNILLRSGEFEVLYADPEFLEFSIGAWSRKWAPTFDRWVKALAIEYDPLENYDRMEDWTDNRDIAGSDKSNHTGNDTTTQTGNDNTSDSGSESQNKTGTENRTEGGSTSSNTSGTTGSTTTNKVSAYDAGNTLTTKDESTVSGTDSSETSGTTSLVVSSGDVMNLTGSHLNSIVASHMTNINANHTISITASHMTADDLIHSGRIHGNIGVTTSQTMLLSELDLGYWNIYEKITDLFLTEFVIPVY